MLASEALKVICIGVSEYLHKPLHLRFAAENARRLLDAFGSPKGCGVPKANVRLLLDGEANCVAVLEAVSEVASACRHEDVLVIYFSGHGEREGDKFFLLTVEADLENLAATAVEADQLRDIISTCPARGVLVILDCCKSAGLAEVAGGLFTTVGGQEFRLLLSASRAGQMSYEFEGFRGTIFSHHLARVVGGEVPIGDRPGIVYFSELFEFLADRVAEDLETIGHDRTVQETVFAGAYARDPRLFILQQVALETLDAEAPRYSRRFVRRARQRAIGLAITVLLVGAAGYYYYLDHARYLGSVTSQVDGHDGNYLAILAGDRRLNALGFPHVLRVTDIPYLAIPDLERVQLPAFSSDDEIDRLIEGALPPEWRAVLAGWANDTQGLLKFVKQTDDDNDLNDDPAGLPKALDLLGFRVGQDGIPDLEANVTGFVTGRTSAALRQLARLVPDRAIALYEDGMDGHPENTKGLLQGLAGPCPADAPEILSQNAQVTYDKNQGRSLNVDPDPMRAIWWAAVFRTGCTLPPTTFNDIYSHEIYRNNSRDLNVILYAMMHRDHEIIQFVQSDLERNAAKVLRRDKSVYWLDAFDSERRVWSDLRLLTAVGAGAGSVLLPDLMAYDLDKNVKVAAARMAVTQSGITPDMVAKAGSDLWIASVLVDHGWWDSSVVERAVQVSLRRSTPNVGSNFGDAMDYLLHMIRRRHVLEAAPIVAEIRDHSEDHPTIVAASRTLDELVPTTPKPGVSSPRTRFFSVISAALVRPLPPSRVASPLPSSDAYVWYITHYDEGFDTWASRMTEATEESVGILFGLQLSDDAMRRLRIELLDPTRKYIAAALLAAMGSEVDLKLVLSSSDLEVRQEGMNYAILNSNLADVLLNLSADGFARETSYALELQVAFKTMALGLLAKVPASEQGLMLSALVAGAWEATPGLRIWSKSCIAALDGNTEDDANELQLFDAH
jgi:hypothetical protein